MSASADYNSDFIDLDDLVYAPLLALAKSNEQLKVRVIDFIRHMGTTQKSEGNDIVKLSNLNVAYDQLRSNSDNGYSMDSMQLQVPILSIVPITNLNVDKAEIEFVVAVNIVNDQKEGYRVTGRISAPEQRESDFLPKVKYKMNISSLPATEGIMRLTDILDSNFVAKQTSSVPVNTDGEMQQDDATGTLSEIQTRKESIRKLQNLYADVTKALERHEKWGNLDNTSDGEKYNEQRKIYVKLQQKIARELQSMQGAITEKESDRILREIGIDQ